MSGIGSRKDASGTLCTGARHQGRNGEPGFKGPATVGPVALGTGVLDVAGRDGWGILGTVAAPERWEGTVTPGITSIGRTGEAAAAVPGAGFVAGVVEARCPLTAPVPMPGPPAAAGPGREPGWSHR